MLNVFKLIFLMLGKNSSLLLTPYYLNPCFPTPSLPYERVYRKNFAFHKGKSVRELIFMLGRLDLHHLVNLRSLKFFNTSKLAEMNPSDMNNNFNTYTHS